MISKNYGIAAFVIFIQYFVAFVILHLLWNLNCIFLFKTLTGKEIEIDIEPTDKVDRIKERVEEKEGIPPQQQRLIFSGKQM